MAGFFIVATAIISTWAWNATSAQAAMILQERDNVRQQKDVAEQERDEANRQRIIANQQKAVAEDNERIAQKQASLALQNIQFVVTDIDAHLRERPGMSDIRIAMLEAVSGKWDELDVEMTEGVRGEAIPTLMAARQLIAAAFRDLDRLQQAQNEFTKLEQMARERIAVKGRTDSTRTNLAKVLIAASPLARRLRSDPAAGIRSLEEASELLREIIRDPQPEEKSPEQNEIQQVLAAATQNLGVEYLREGRLAETSRMFTESLDANTRVLENIRSEAGFEDLDINQKDGRTAGRQDGRSRWINLASVSPIFCSDLEKRMNPFSCMNRRLPVVESFQSTFFNVDHQNGTGRSPWFRNPQGGSVFEGRRASN